MINDPEITVLTIVYNGERYIREAIDSILNQTYNNFEYILVDNNSTDSTPQILRHYAQKDERIRTIKEIKQGILYARNAGLQIAKGDWVAVLDADDIALPDRLECQLDFVKKNQGVVLVGSGHILIDANGKFLKKGNYPSDHESLVRYLEDHRSIFAQSSAFFKRQVVAELGGYRFPGVAEDYDLWLRLSMHGEIACIHQPLIKLRRHTMSHSYYVSQEPYILHKVVALVCHLRRKRGLSDPSLAQEQEWNNFLRWTKERMESSNAFEKGKAKRELSRIRHSTETSKLYRVFQIIYQLLSNRFARAYLLERSYLRNAAVQIAKESETIWR